MSSMLSMLPDPRSKISALDMLASSPPPAAPLAGAFAGTGAWWPMFRAGGCAALVMLAAGWWFCFGASPGPGAREKVMFVKRASAPGAGAGTGAGALAVAGGGAWNVP